MQGNVLSFPKQGRDGASDEDQNPGAAHTLAYILEMLPQLARLAAESGEPTLGAILYTISERFSSKARPRALNSESAPKAQCGESAAIELGESSSLPSTPH
jgi:hypothetical protein